jgi:hypothetical protein
VELCVERVVVGHNVAVAPVDIHIGEQLSDGRDPDQVDHVPLVPNHEKKGEFPSAGALHCVKSYMGVP